MTPLSSVVFGNIRFDVCDEGMDRFTIVFKINNNVQTFTYLRMEQVMEYIRIAQSAETGMLRKFI